MREPTHPQTLLASLKPVKLFIVATCNKIKLLHLRLQIPQTDKFFHVQMKEMQLRNV